LLFAIIDIEELIYMTNIDALKWWVEEQR
jgi:hypothetical protein